MTHNIEQQEHHSHNEGGILTIEQLLGPKVNINAITVDLDRILRRKRDGGIVLSVFDEDGMKLTQDCLWARGVDERVDPLDYKDTFDQWRRLLEKWGIAALPYEEQERKVHLLARILYCNGKVEEAKSIDFGYGADVQNNPEGRVECPYSNALN
ncbi:MAG: hypothetical protein WCT41_01605 [Candidatus Paceibacterota bacterium]|jgi:hypothetical protein